MGTDHIDIDIAIGDEKFESSFSDEEEEALSLCDLPVSLSKGEEEKENQSSNNEAQTSEVDDNFEFGSWGGRGSLWTESEMCAADDVFFRGQILPLRLSVSSENGVLRIRPESRNPSRSESMDHSSSSGFTSTSSRSSSSRSHQSSSSTNSTVSTANTSKPPRIRNQFQTHPTSPKPQIRVSGSRPGNVGSHRSQTQKWTIWSLFRLGLVRTPKIELQDLKLRNNNKSFSSNSNNNNISYSNDERKRNQENNKQRSSHRRVGLIGGGGCKCSANAVDNVVIIKSKKVVSAREVCIVQQQQQQRRRREGRQDVADRRTFEWLKELSVAGGSGTRESEEA